MSLAISIKIGLIGSMSDRLGIDLIKQLLAIPKIKVPILYPSEYRVRLTIVESLHKFKTGQNTGNY